MALKNHSHIYIYMKHIKEPKGSTSKICRHAYSSSLPTLGVASLALSSLKLHQEDENIRINNTRNDTI